MVGGGGGWWWYEGNLCDKDLNLVLCKANWLPCLHSGAVFGNSIYWLYFYFSGLTSCLLLLGLITLNMLKNKLLPTYIFMI